MPRTKVSKNRYAPGLAMIDEIVRAAEKVLSEQGHAALSLRKVAEECGLKIGNLSYYFPAKHHLIAAMLESIIAGYSSSADEIEARTATDPEEALTTYLLRWMRENEVVRTNRIYIEIWSMANNDDQVREAMDRFYSNGRARIARMMVGLNPRLTDEEAAAMALHAVATMEGLMLFSNHDPKAAAQMPRLAAYTVASTIAMVKTQGSGRA